MSITPTDITKAESLLYQALKDQFPTYNFNKGSNLRDLVVKTLAYGLAYIRDEKSKVLARTNFASLATLTDADADSVVDALVSNFFISRNSGGKSSGVITIYLTNNVDVLVKASTRFIKRDGISFRLSTETDTVFPASNLNQTTDEDGNIVEYWFNIPVTAVSEGVVGDVESGIWESWTPFNAYVSRIENQSSFANGLEEEDNLSLIERARDAVTVRNLINTRSVSTVLLDRFSQLSNVVTVGAGDDEMQRDLVTIASLGLDIHVLGKMDHYLWLPIVESQTLTATVEDQRVELTGITTPIYRIRSVTYMDGLDLVTLESSNEAIDEVSTGKFRYQNVDHTTAFSLEEERYVYFNADIEGEEVTITYDTVSGMSEIDEFVTARTNRVICADPMCKLALPVYLSMILLYVVREDATEVLDEAEVAQEVAAYINAHTGDLYVSNIIAYIMDTWGHIIENIRTPLNVNYSLLSTEGYTVEYTTTNKVEIAPEYLTNFEEDPYPVPSNFSMSSRVMRYIASPSDITVQQDV